MKNKLLAISVTLLLALDKSIAQRNIDPTIQARIDDFINNVYRPLISNSGMALAIVRDDGELLYTTGYGYANWEGRVAFGNDTDSMLASVTKSFTAIVAGQVLHEKFPELGEAVLDTPIRELMPEVNFTLIDRFRSEHASFRDLIAHRLCIPRDDIQQLSDPFNTTAEILYRMRYKTEACGIRSDFQYNNQMYIVAGELIGILAGRPYMSLVEDLLNEIGMMNTSFVRRNDDFSQMPSRALPHYVLDDELHVSNEDLAKRPELTAAAGGLFSTANDMIRYMMFQLNDGSVDGRQVVPKEVMEWMRKPSLIMPFQSYKNSEGDALISHFAYALGLQVSSYDGWEYINHGGSFPPYYSQMSMYPGKKLGIFSMTNTGPGPLYTEQAIVHSFIFQTLAGSKKADAIAKKVKDRSLLKQTRNFAKKERDEFYAKNRDKFERAKLQNPSQIVVGKYGSGSSGDIEISERFNQETNQMEFYMEYGRWFNGWLMPVNEGGSQFYIKWETDVYQDNYAVGMERDSNTVAFDNDTLVLVGPWLFFDEYKLGQSLDVLPPIPWAPGSCGPEAE